MKSQKYNVNLNKHKMFNEYRDNKYYTLFQRAEYLNFKLNENDLIALDNMDNFIAAKFKLIYGNVPTQMAKYLNNNLVVYHSYHYREFEDWIDNDMKMFLGISNE